MHHEPEIPRDPESERRGHELRDVAAKPILYFVIGLIVFGGVLQVVMSTIMQGYVAADSKIPEPSADILRDTGRIDQAAPLQRDTTADMRAMYAGEDLILESKVMRDKTTGKVRVPIERAMEIVAKKGLPTRKDAPKSDEPGLPYLKRATPYQTKY